MAVGDGAGAGGQVERWVRQQMGLAPGASVAVREIPGTDPRCADLVTEVRVDAPGEPPVVFHVERSLGEVEEMDVIATLAFGGGH